MCVPHLRGGWSRHDDNASSPIGVSSFTLHIDPTVTLEHNARVATVTILAACGDGQRLRVNVTLTQDAASGRGVGIGECTGGLERYEVTVSIQGRDGLGEGPAEVAAEAVIGDRGLIVGTLGVDARGQVVGAR